MKNLLPASCPFLPLLRNRRFVIASIILLMLSLAPVAVLTRASIPFFIKIPFMFLTPGAALLLLYYAACRWVRPALEQTAFHRRLLLALSALMVGISVSVWLVWNSDYCLALMQAMLSVLAKVIPVDAQSVVYAPYAPLTAFVLLTSMAALMFLIAMTLAGRMKVVRRFLLQGGSRKIFSAIYILLLLSVSTAIFSTDALELAPGQASVIWWGGTEDYVTYPLRQTELGFADHMRLNGGFMIGMNPDTDQVQVYRSSSGLYGALLKLIQDVFAIPAEPMIVALRVLFAFLLAMTFTLLSVGLKRQFGVLASLVFSALPLATYWILGPARHLIWFYFLLFMPFLTSVIFYPRVLNGRWTFKRFLWVPFAAGVVLFLRGYTYFPNLILSAAIPVFYYDLKAKKPFKTWLGHGFWVCLMGVGGLLLAMGIHLVQLSLYEGSVSGALGYFLNRAETRGPGNTGVFQTTLGLFDFWLHVPVLYFSQKWTALFPQWLLQYEWKPLFDRMNTLLALHLLVLAGAVTTNLMAVFNRKGWIRHHGLINDLHTLLPLGWATLAAMLASWAWFPAQGHMSAHPHMNGVMYMIPFGLTAFLFLGAVVHSLVHWVFAPRRQD